MESGNYTHGTPARSETPNWGTFIFLIIAHFVAIGALFFWSCPAVITAVILYWVGGSLGIGMGWHRLLTHRGYSCLLYTSDAADERSSVDLGGRRIIKK